MTWPKASGLNICVSGQENNSRGVKQQTRHSYTTKKIAVHTDKLLSFEHELILLEAVN